MRYTKLVTAALLLGTLLALVIIGTARAEGPANTTSFGAGVAGVWFDGPEAPGPTLEATGRGAMSLSPHISLVGSAAWGLTGTYIRTTVGGRFTVSDADNPDFSVGLGVQYHSASVASLRPNEWCPDATVGLRPWPARWPAMTLTATGW